MPEARPAFAQAFSLSGEVAVVTGGGTGLGFAMSSTLLAAGAKVVITGRRANVLDAAVAKLGSGAYCCQHDITDSTGIAPLIERISHDVGEPTILINNAGTHLKKPLVETTDAEFHRVLATHVEGAFAMSRAVVPRMKARGHGSVRSSLQ